MDVLLRLLKLSRCNNNIKSCSGQTKCCYCKVSGYCSCTALILVYTHYSASLIAMVNWRPTFKVETCRGAHNEGVMLQHHSLHNHHHLALWTSSAVSGWKIARRRCATSSGPGWVRFACTLTEARPPSLLLWWLLQSVCRPCMH